MSKELMIFVDADSIAAAAGFVEHPDEVRFVCDTKLNSIMEACQCKNMKGFVEAWDWKQNFRKHVSVSRVYKGTRGIKPKWMTEAKMYMVEKYGFEVVRWCESEDAVACSMYNHGLEYSFGSAIDKDVINGVAGRWWNYSTGEWTITTYEQALRFEAWQVIVGDNCDNVPGLPGVGEKGAKVIDGVPLDQLYLKVAEMYKSRGMTFGYFNEQCRLIHVRRYINETPYMPVSEEQWEAIKCD